jgi:RNA polymerase sigma-70 factor (sigma-E family)
MPWAVGLRRCDSARTLRRRVTGMRANYWRATRSRDTLRAAATIPPGCEPALRPGLARSGEARLGGLGPQTREGPSAADADAARADLISTLYQTHAVALVRTAKLLVHDQPTAEDVVQDAFLGLYRALPRLKDHDQILPYLRAAVINGSRSVLRARRRALLRVQHEPPASSAESAAMTGEDHRQVLDAVGRLSRRGREVLVLRYYLGLPDQEIAAALGVSRGTVSSTASRALAVLARELREDL